MRIASRALLSVSVFAGLALAGCGQSRVEYKKEIIQGGPASPPVGNTGIASPVAGSINSLDDVPPVDVGAVAGSPVSDAVAGSTDPHAQAGADPRPNADPQIGPSGDVVGPNGPSGLGEPVGSLLTGPIGPSGPSSGPSQPSDTGASPLAAPIGPSGPSSGPSNSSDTGASSNPSDLASPSNSAVSHDPASNPPDRTGPDLNPLPASTPEPVASGVEGAPNNGAVGPRIVDAPEFPAPPNADVDTSVAIADPKDMSTADVSSTGLTTTPDPTTPDSDVESIVVSPDATPGPTPSATVADNAVTDPTSPDLGSSAPGGEASAPSKMPPFKRLRIRPLTSSAMPENQFGWQKWASPKKRSASLSVDEFNSLGDFAVDEKRSTGDDEDEKIYSFENEQVRRCVYRNRLLEGLGEKGTIPVDPTVELPPPFGHNQFFCVKEKTGSIRSEVRISVKPDDLFVQVRWLGSTGYKLVPSVGRFDVQFKLTSRVAFRQAFAGAAKAALQDDFDSLLSVSPTVGSGSSCAAERTYFLTIPFVDGVPQSARIWVDTRHFSVHEFQNSFFIERRAVPLNYFHADHKVPVLNGKAILACQAQHQAWVHCVKDSKTGQADSRCEPAVTAAVEKNFRMLIDARQPGFASNRVFTLKRAEANGKEGMGSLLVWHDPEIVGSNAEPYNPLSLEDFAEMVDAIDLKIVK